MSHRVEIQVAPFPSLKVWFLEKIKEKKGIKELPKKTKSKDFFWDFQVLLGEREKRE